MILESTEANRAQGQALSTLRMAVQWAHAAVTQGEHDRAHEENMARKRADAMKGAGPKV